ncbi:MAG: VapC toxin family PIN domain ribonuclease [Comamonadaceae bacterium CG_4_9_14_0_8_um_filter_60_18]|nr:MAG: VapC toxin family PIN domain ribonuclease [Comamonadaceae bacterium CG_4_9_14_0_8_um_filter_60_18]
MNMVDSSGWIEYLLDTDRADLFAAPIEQRATLLVPVIALFKVHKVLSRKVPPDAVTQCLNVMRLGRVLEITDRRAVAAAEIAAQHRLAMAEAMMYSLALELGATFWTQNVDYQGLPSVTYFVKP